MGVACARRAGYSHHVHRYCRLGHWLGAVCCDESRLWRIRMVIGWWLVAFAIHFAWNYDLVALTPMVIKVLIIMVAMYYIFARLCIVSTKLYREDVGHSYTSEIITRPDLKCHQTQ